MANELWNWRFFGIQWLGGGKPVQEWFNQLPEEARDEARDSVGYLQHLPIASWKKPKFDPLKGEEVSEVRFETDSHTYRIYGYYGPSEQGRQVYTFLFGHDKKVRNDAKGKREATRRKGLIERRHASVHKFEFYPSLD
jgi:hypothetical protein